MGDIADSMLDGTICAGCGEYLDQGSPGYAQYCGPDCEPAPATPKQDLGPTCQFPPWSREGTSFTAAAMIEGEPAHKQRLRVLHFIRSKGEFGATDDEIIHELDLAHNAAHPRRWELAGLNRRADFPTLIALNGEKRPTIKKRPANVWIAIKANAFTLGNPDSYEALFKRTTHAGPPMKAAQGVVYENRADAQAVLDADPAGFIPPKWVNGRQVPGKIYGVMLPKSFDVCAEKCSYGFRLIMAVPLVRLDK